MPVLTPTPEIHVEVYLDLASSYVIKHDHISCQLCPMWMIMGTFSLYLQWQNFTPSLRILCATQALTVK